MPERAIEVVCAGERVVLLAERAAWWPGARTLLVADVHLGKAEALRARGAALPSATNHEALERLARLINEADARRVVVLGDLLHAPVGLTPQVVDDVTRWRRQVRAEWVVVPGNHDRRIERVAEAWGLVVAPALWCDGPFAFVHDAATLGCPPLPDADHASGTRGAAGAFVWSGHVHPVARLRGAGHAVRLPCFVLGERGAVLPAFSRFTGGVAVGALAGERLYACAEDVVIAAPPENRSSTRATKSR